MSAFRTTACVAAALLLAACEKRPVEPLPLGTVHVTIVSGDGQTGSAGQELPQPLVVKVTGSNGKGIRGQLVNFRVTAGGGRVYAGSSLTDMNGVAQDYWTLGTPGAQQVEVVAVEPTTGAKQNFGTFSATALAPALLSLTPSNGSFGTVTQGSSSAPQTFTIANTGNESSGAVSVSLSGTNAGDFQIATNSCGAPIAGGASCTVSVVFSPTASGARSATLQASASPGGSASSSLSGSGALAATLTVTPVTFNFGSLVVGGTSSAQTFTVQNTGGASASGLSTAIGGTNAGDFVIAGSTCTGATLNPGQTCLVGVQFHPTTGGSRAGSLNVSATGGVAGTASLIGTGVLPAQLSVSPTSYAFPSTAVGTAAVAVTFTVTNTGQQTSGTVNVSVTGANAQDFIMPTNLCVGLTLAAGQSCNVIVNFVPTSTGTRTATLTAAASPGGSASAALSGSAYSTTPLIAIAPTSYNFGSVVLGTSSAPQQFTVTNVGQGTTGALSMLLTGTNAAAFSMSANTCTGAVLNAGASCTVSVTFTPALTGSHTATLSATGSPGGSATSSLTGTGVIPATLSINPNSIDFFTQPIGVPSRATTFTVTNTGGTTTGVVSAALTGPQSADYSITRNTCAGMTLAPGASCQIDVVFTPSASGIRVAALGVSAVPGGSASASLSGTGS